MYDLFNNVLPVVAITPQTIVNSGSPENLVSGNIDLQFYEAAQVYAVLGDIDELGSSPVGSAKVELKLEDSDDGSTFENVTLVDVIGPTSVSSGIVATISTDQAVGLRVGYRGGKRYLKVTLIPTGLSNGGTICAVVEKGNYRHNPVS